MSVCSVVVVAVLMMVVWSPTTSALFVPKAVSVSIRGAGNLDLSLKDSADQSGAIVEKVKPKSFADTMGFQVGDKIVGINGVKFRSATAINSRLRNVERPFVLTKIPAANNANDTSNGNNGNSTSSFHSLKSSAATSTLHRALAVVFRNAKEIDFTIKQINREMFVANVGAHSRRYGVEVGDMLYAVNGETIKKGKSAQTVLKDIRANQFPLAIAFNGDEPDAPESSNHVNEEGHDKKLRATLTASDEPCDKDKDAVPVVSADYNEDNPLSFTKDSALNRNSHQYWNTVLDPDWKAKSWPAPMPVTELQRSQLHAEHEKAYESSKDSADNKNETSTTTATETGTSTTETSKSTTSTTTSGSKEGSTSKITVITRLREKSAVDVGSPLRLQTFVKNAKTYVWEFNLKSEASQTDKNWSLLTFGETASWKIDKVRSSDSGTYRVIAFGEDMADSITQYCTVTIKQDKEGDVKAFGNNAHKLNECIDAMNANPDFFLVRDGLKLPSKACKIGFDFCHVTQERFCSQSRSRNEMQCEPDVSCRHLIRECYAQHYDSRLLFAECFYTSAVKPHPIKMSTDASLRSLEIDLAKIPEFLPSRFKYDVWVPVGTPTIRIKASAAIGASRMNIRVCGNPESRPDGSRMLTGDWSDECAVGGPSGKEDSSYCIEVTAQDGQSSLTYSVTVHMGETTTDEILHQLHIPELNFEFSHDRIYYSELDAGDKSRLQIIPADDEKNLEIWVSMNGFPARQTDLVDLIPGRNMIQVTLRSGTIESPIYTVFVKRNLVKSNHLKSAIDEPSSAKDSVYTLASMRIVSSLSPDTNLVYSPSKFHPNWVVYRTSPVAYDCWNVSMVLEPNDPKSFLSVNGIARSWGVQTAPIPLLEGTNIIEMVVTSGSGLVFLNYRVFIERTASVNSSEVSMGGGRPPTLSQIRLFWGGDGSANVKTDLLTMIYRVRENVSEVYVVPTASAATALVSIREDSVHNGFETHIYKPHRPFKLQDGPNRFDVVVWEPSTRESTLYTLILERPVAVYEGRIDSTLESLTTNADIHFLESERGSDDVGALSPQFNPAIKEYYVKVVADVPRLVIWAEPSDPDALVLIDGNASDADDGSLPIRVSESAEMTIEIEVTAADNNREHRTVYILHVRRADHEGRLQHLYLRYCPKVGDSSRCDQPKYDILESPNHKITAEPAFDAEYRVYIPRGMFFRYEGVGKRTADGGGARLEITDIDGTVRKLGPKDETKQAWFQMQKGNIRQAVLTCISEDRSNSEKIRLTLIQDDKRPVLTSIEILYATEAAGTYWEKSNFQNFQTARLDKLFNPFVKEYEVQVGFDLKALAVRVMISDDVPSSVEASMVDPVKQSFLNPTIYRTFSIERERQLEYSIIIDVAPSAQVSLPFGPNILRISTTEQDDDSVSGDTQPQIVNYHVSIVRKFDSITNIIRDKQVVSRDAKLSTLMVLTSVEDSNKVRKIPDELIEPPFDPSYEHSRQRFRVTLPEDVTRAWVLFSPHQTEHLPYLTINGDAQWWWSKNPETMSPVKIIPIDIKNKRSGSISIGLTATDTETHITYNVKLLVKSRNVLEINSFTIGKTFLKLFFSTNFENNEVNFDPSALTIRSKLPPHQSFALEPRLSKRKSSPSIQFGCDSMILFQRLRCFDEETHAVYLQLTENEKKWLGKFESSSLELVVASNRLLVPSKGNSSDSHLFRMSNRYGDQFIVDQSGSSTYLRRWYANLDSRALLVFEFSDPIRKISFNPALLTFYGSDGKPFNFPETSFLRVNFPIVKNKNGQPETLPNILSQPNRWGVLSFRTAPAEGSDSVFFATSHPNTVVLQIQDAKVLETLRVASRALCSENSRALCSENSRALSISDMAELLSTYFPVDSNGVIRTSCDDFYSVFRTKTQTEYFAGFIKNLLCEDGKVTYEAFVTAVKLDLVPIDGKAVDFDLKYLTWRELEAPFIRADGSFTSGPVTKHLRPEHLAEIYRFAMTPKYNKLENSEQPLCQERGATANDFIPGVSVIPARVLKQATLSGMVLPTNLAKELWPSIEKVLAAKDLEPVRQTKCVATTVSGSCTERKSGSEAVCASEASELENMAKFPRFSIELDRDDSKFDRMLSSLGVADKNHRIRIKTMFFVRACKESNSGPSELGCVGFPEFSDLVTAQIAPLAPLLTVQHLLGLVITQAISPAIENNLRLFQLHTEVSTTPAGWFVKPMDILDYTFDYSGTPVKVKGTDEKWYALEDLENTFSPLNSVWRIVEHLFEINTLIHATFSAIDEAFAKLAGGSNATVIQNFMLEDRLIRSFGMTKLQATLVAESCQIYGELMRKEHYDDMVLRQLVPAVITAEPFSAANSKCGGGQGDLSISYPLTLAEDEKLRGVQPTLNRFSHVPATIVVSADTEEGCLCSETTIERRDFSTAAINSNSLSSIAHFVSASTLSTAFKLQQCEVIFSTCHPRSSKTSAQQNVIDWRDSDSMNLEANMFCLAKGNIGKACMHGAGVCVNSQAVQLPLQPQKSKASSQPKSWGTCVQVPRIRLAPKSALLELGPSNSGKTSITVLSSLFSTCSWYRLDESGNCEAEPFVTCVAEDFVNVLDRSRSIIEGKIDGSVSCPMTLGELHTCKLDLTATFTNTPDEKLLLQNGMKLGVRITKGLGYIENCNQPVHVNFMNMVSFDTM
eukprot:c12687_g1_i1.p1 GENE.c12687_g1_i1~~c12687_g1_i1.p1  ORF type:complete len:2682 (+),score=588.69 c12687_g1_i1:65-8047(+)